MPAWSGGPGDRVGRPLPGEEPAPPSWGAAVARLSGYLLELEVRDGRGAPLAPDEGFRRWAERTREVAVARQALYLVGNGASASMACHLAADLGKNVALRAQVFTDPALVTALANDLGVERLFAEPIRLWGRAGDLLVVISSSGRSPNVLAACREARALGLTVVTLSAMGPDNPLRTLGDLNLWVAARSYGDAESCHAAILHRWADLVMEQHARAAAPPEEVG